MNRELARRLLAELMGAAFLAAIVIGSGIAAQHLSPGNVGLQLFENAAATAAGLFAIILVFGPISGAHFNPVVSLVDAAFGGLRWRDALAYIPAQVVGCILGAIVANAMFALGAISISTKHRASPSHFLSEIVATLGLLLVIFALARTRRGASAAAAVGAYIGAAYFFTSSTSFANPAITIGRMFSDTFAGIAPASAPVYIAAQLVGGAIAVVAIKGLYPHVTPAQAADVVVPRAPEEERDGSIASDDSAPATSSPLDGSSRSSRTGPAANAGSGPTNWTPGDAAGGTPQRLGGARTASKPLPNGERNARHDTTVSNKKPPYHRGFSESG